MKSKLQKIIIVSFFLIIGIISYINFDRINYYTYALYYKIEKKIINDPDVENLKHFDQKAFESKIKKPIPKWMIDRISKELSVFSTKKISQQSLNYTFNKVISAQVMYRFRIIDNNLYVYKKPYKYDIVNDPLCLLVKILKSSKVYKLSHADLIMTYYDGMPLPHMPKNYWIVDNIENQAPIFTPAKLEASPYFVCIPDRITTGSWPVLSKKISLANRIHRPWKRKQKKAFWRGGHSDFNPPLNYQSEQIKNLCQKCPRYILSSLASVRSDIIDAGYPQASSEVAKPLIESFIKKAVSQQKHIAYAYLPTLDGAMCTYPGYLWRLLSNSVAFKQESDASQWFYDALKPYEHYIPIKQDMSDLIAKIEWAKNHDAECIQISNNATNFVKQNLMIEDIYLYFYLLLEKYISCQNFDKKVLIEDTCDNPLWERLE